MKESLEQLSKLIDDVENINDETFKLIALLVTTSIERVVKEGIIALKDIIENDSTFSDSSVDNVAKARADRSDLH